MLKLENICRSFKEKDVLENINLSFEKDKIYAILGRNGVGKSTLLNITNGTDYDYKGKVLLNESPLQLKTESLQKVFLCSDTILSPILSNFSKVEKIIDFLYDTYPKFDYQKSKKLIEEFEIDLKSNYSKMSLGQQSLFLIILGLCINCDYVLLDEPVLGLDEINREKVYKYIIEVQNAIKNTFIITSHLVDELAFITTDVIILKDKKVVLNDTLESILESYYEVSGSKEDINATFRKEQVVFKQGENIKKIIVKGKITEKNPNLTYRNPTLDDIFKGIVS